LEVVHHLLHALGGSSIAGSSLALVFIVHSSGKRHSSVCGLDAELLALQPRIGAELGLDVAGKLRVIGRLRATHCNR
jgi:hypothetical protein